MHTKCHIFYVNRMWKPLQMTCWPLKCFGAWDWWLFTYLRVSLAFGLPTDCVFWVSLNCLEFIAALASLWVDSIEGSTASKSCILNQTDSTAAVDWLWKPCFDKVTHPAQMKVARKLAQVILGADCCLYSQWFEGLENVLADSLSRDFHLSDIKLTSLLTFSVPLQLPPSFEIKMLPKEISLWLTLLLCNQPEPLPTQSKPLQSKLALGRGTMSIFQTLASLRTHSLILSQLANGTGYWDVLPKLYKTEDSVQNDLTDSHPKSSKPLWITYLWPFGLITGWIPVVTAVVNVQSFYEVNLKGMPMPTLPNDLKKQSLLPFFANSVPSQKRTKR